MKIFGKLKLNQLHKDELTLRKMEYLHGGDVSGNCVCGGLSSTEGN